MILMVLIDDEIKSSLSELVLSIIFFVGVASVVLNKTFIYAEQQYALRYRKPFFTNFIFIEKRLKDQQLYILKHKFHFYNKLNSRQQKIFKHRLTTFINNKKFVGREGLEVNEKMITLISATAVLLTFGFRNYLIKIIDTVVIYPKAYYSTTNKTLHKGETNPQYRTIVFSWEDFERGYIIGDDNLNLGIHEFGHAIHLNAFKQNGISNTIFTEGFKDLTDYLQNHEAVRKRLIASKYFRAYAFTNQFEFFAVLLENFIETPTEFKTQFPDLYQSIKVMLNFRFLGY